MSNLAYLLKCATEPAYRSQPPKQFLLEIGMADAGKGYSRYAWRLFKEIGRVPGLTEIRTYIRERKLGVDKDDDEDTAGRVGCVESHFLDSGAFSHWTKADKYAAKHNCDKWQYFEQPEYFAYLDGYAEFIKKYTVAIDFYANVDVIGNPELTWRNQQYLEERGVNPVPVVHYLTDLKWLKHYIDNGYELIGLGGLVGSTAKDGCRGWLDQCFDLVCDTPDRTPKVKLHGFGVTVYELLLRYPWYSVDSTSWIQVGAFGGILIPHKRNNQFVFTEQPWICKTSHESPDRKLHGKHYETLTQLEKDIVKEWLAVINIPLGESTEDEQTILSHGVLNRHSERKMANILFFEQMRKSLPDYPWPFRSTRRRNLGIF